MQQILPSPRPTGGGGMQPQPTAERMHLYVWPGAPPAHNWIRIGFSSDPDQDLDPDPALNIIRLRIRVPIQGAQSMRIHTDPGPDWLASNFKSNFLHLLQSRGLCLFANFCQFQSNWIRLRMSKSRNQCGSIEALGS